MKKDIAWGYAAQFLQYGAALLVLPLLLRKLTSAELGIWYVLLTVSTFVIMLDMGFTPTLSRNVTYVLSGAKKLHKDGFESAGGSLEVDYGLLRVLIDASKKIFFWLSAIAFLLMGSLGTWFILVVARGQVQFHVVLATWAIFVLSTIINLYFKYYTPLLQGRGMFAEYYRASAISNIGFVAAIAVFLFAGFGLVGVSLSFLFSALIGRWLCGKYLYDSEFSARIRNAPAAAATIREVILTLWNNAWRLGLVVVGSFFILKANTLIASAYLGLATTATYALTIQFFSTIGSVSIVAVTIQQQKMAQCRVTGNNDGLLKLVNLGLTSSIFLYSVGALLVVTFGGWAIDFIGGHTRMFANPLLSIVAVMLLLELNHSVSGSIIVTRNVVPFVKPSLVSGLAVIVGSVIGLHFFKLGVWWLVAMQLVVQASYNNWKWPLVLAREFETSYLSFLTGGTRIIANETFGILKRVVVTQRKDGAV